MRGRGLRLGVVREERAWWLWLLWNRAVGLTVSYCAVEDFLELRWDGVIDGTAMAGAAECGVAFQFSVRFAVDAVDGHLARLPSAMPHEQGRVRMPALRAQPFGPDVAVVGAVVGHGVHGRRERWTSFDSVNLILMTGTPHNTQRLRLSSIQPWRQFSGDFALEAGTVKEGLV